jgi:hypothetical protein
MPMLGKGSFGEVFLVSTLSTSLSKAQRGCAALH